MIRSTRGFGIAAAIMVFCAVISVMLIGINFRSLMLVVPAVAMTAQWIVKVRRDRKETGPGAASDDAISKESAPRLDPPTNTER